MFGKFIRQNACLPSGEPIAKCLPEEVEKSGVVARVTASCDVAIGAYDLRLRDLGPRDDTDGYVREARGVCDDPWFLSLWDDESERRVQT